MNPKRPETFPSDLSVLVRALLAGPEPPETYEEWALFFDRFRALEPEHWRRLVETKIADSAYLLMGWHGEWEKYFRSMLVVDSPWKAAVKRYLEEDPTRRQPC